MKRKRRKAEGREREVMLVYGQGGDGNNRKDLGQRQYALFVSLLSSVCVL